MHDKHIAKWDFEAFKSNVCHQVKTLGALDFILNTLQNDSIRCYWDNLCYREAFYLLAMLDYLSSINDIPMCTRYDDIRDYSLQKPVYPKDHCWRIC